MKNNMELYLKKPTPAGFDHLVEALFSLINRLKDQHDNLFKEYVSCLQIRKDRKTFEKIMSDAIGSFDRLPERKQMEIELHFYRAVKKLEKITPQKKNQLKEEKGYLFYVILCRELNKILAGLKKYQGIMSSRLYPDRTKEISSDPKLYNELVEAWGDLAKED